MLICDYSFAVYPFLQCNIGQLTYFGQPFFFQHTFFPKNSADKSVQPNFFPLIFLFWFFFYFTVHHICIPEVANMPQIYFWEINLQNFLDFDTSSTVSTVLSKLQNAGPDFNFLGTLLPCATQLLLWYIVSTPKQPNCKKRCGPCKKKQHEKSCEIKGGGPEVAVVVW